MSDLKRRDKNLMPIGRFSTACRLSIKALRYYDERAILKPAYVDPATGYRYYRQTQGRDAVLISLLRSVDIPLDRIKPMLTAKGDALQEYLALERQRLEDEIENKRHALNSIDRLSQFGELTPYDVAIRSAPDYRLASMKRNTTIDRMVMEAGELIYELIDELKRHDIEPDDPFMCINDAPDSQGNLVVVACVGSGGEDIENSHTSMLDVCGGPEAWLRHVGAYEELGIAYHSLSAWAQAHGHEQRCSLREIYLNDPVDTRTEDLVTEVIFPIMDV